MSEPPSEPVKVRSGTFRVDRKEALRKLAAYRLTDAAGFVLCWLRAAAASEPTWIQVTLDRERVEIRFDGKAWPADVLEDPYTAFFEEGGAARVRHLVTGSLAAFQLGARRVVTTSGGSAMALYPDTVERLEVPVDRVETAFEAQWESRFDEDHLASMMRYVTQHCGMLGPQLSVSTGGRAWVVPPLAPVEGTPALRFESGALKGFLRPPADPRARSGKAHFYQAGILVSSVDWSFSPAQVDAHLDDEAFTLDASQSSVVMDASFQRALDAAESNVPRLLARALDEHEQSYPGWARFLFDRSGLLSALIRKAKFDRPRPTDHALAWLAGYGDEYARLTAWDAGPGAWLRTAACTLPSDEPEDAVLKRLYLAPLYVTVNGTLMSIKDLDTTAKYTGQLPVCRTLFPGEYLDPPVLWCPWRGDPVVERRFGDRAQFHTEVTNFRDVRPSSGLKTLLAACLLLSAARASAGQDNPTVDELCSGYRVMLEAGTGSKPKKSLEYVRRVNAVCELYTKERLTDASRPGPNWRATVLGQGESSARIFRGGQPSSGTALAAARAEFGVDTIVDLRFDPSYRPFAETFGAGARRLPVSENESRYRYAAERESVSGAGMKSVYAPTLPELEHFVGRYVPRLDKGPGSKAWACRLPELPDGPARHWLNEPPQTPEEVALLEKRGEKPLLVSAFEDCRDWAEVYGKAAVESWMADADRASALANQLFIAVAERVRGLAGAGRKVMYHCAGGTDRAGRVSLVVEAKEYGVTREQVRAYKGPFSDPKIDLIVVDYLLSQRSGLLPQYRYFFPDLKDPAKSWLYQALEPLSADTTTPALEAWSD